MMGVAAQPIELTVNGVAFRMMPVEGGTFTMGATGTLAENAESYELPIHEVTLSDYMIGETEVTQQLWQAVMGENPSYFKGYDQQPVEYVSWDDCQEFVDKLNQISGLKFRLPTEAEWEYAAKGGNKGHGYLYSGSDNPDEVAWYDDNSECEIQYVATKAPNELGIYDMSGNVWEWCEDWKSDYLSQPQTNPKGPESGTLHACRGGAWSFSPLSCRVSARNFDTPAYRNYFLGLRLVLDPESLGESENRNFTSDGKLANNDYVTVNGVTFRMMPVAGDTFTMGATGKLANGAYDNEKPTHQVTLSDYKIGETEVTQQLWEAVMGENPSHWKGENLPVEQVSWNACQEFIKRLNELTGLNFRLPTEAEWEYAARGGSKGDGFIYSGSDEPYDVAWFGGSSGNKTHPVASKAPNELGIYDMTGNVWEYCEDWKGNYSAQPQVDPKGAASGTERVARGGAWDNSPYACRVSSRGGKLPEYGSFNCGLRLAQ